MKRTLLTLALSMLFLSLAAQDFSIVSVESLPADMSAREETKTDHSDRQCALLRIATQNITPKQREGFSFVPDLGSEVVERATRDGEIWLWVSPGLKYLRIKHRDWGQYELRMPDYVARVEALHPYKVVIKGTFKEPDPDPTPTQQYLVFQLSPANAVLEVNGQLWEVAPDGTAMKFVDFGTYSYRVQAPNYHTATGTVTVHDPENTQTVPVSLQPDFVEVTLKVDADAEIWVNNEKRGTRTWTGSLGKGTYKIECKQAGHETTTTTQPITADMNGRTITLPAPKPVYGSLNVESTPNFAKLYIDGKAMGETPKYVSEILIGQHEIRLTKEGYQDYTETVSITKGERRQVKVTMESDGTTSQPTKPQPSQQVVSKHSPNNSVFFVMANAAYSMVPQTSLGLTVGSAKRMGWYVSLGSDFSFDNTDGDFTCDASGNWVNQFVGEYEFTGESKTSRLAATAGMVVRIIDPLYAYVGAGYGYRNLYWRYTSDNAYGYAKNVDHSYEGLSLDAGLMLHFRGFGFSLGVQTVAFDYLEAKVGIGYTFKR